MFLQNQNQANFTLFCFYTVTFPDMIQATVFSDLCFFKSPHSHLSTLWAEGFRVDQIAGHIWFMATSLHASGCRKHGCRKHDCRKHGCRKHGWPNSSPKMKPKCLYRPWCLAAVMVINSLFHVSGGTGDKLKQKGKSSLQTHFSLGKTKSQRD